MATSERSPIAGAPTSTTGRTLRLLIVDDSEPDAKLILYALRRTGRQVDAVRLDDEGELRTALANGSWDLVVSDWSLPTFSGSRALALVKELSPQLPFIVVSGSIDEQFAVEAMRAGALSCVLKQNLAQLPAVVERALAAVTPTRRSPEG